MFIKLTTLSSKQTAYARSEAIESVEAKIASSDSNPEGSTITMSSGQTLTVREQVADVYKLLQGAT